MYLFVIRLFSLDILYKLWSLFFYTLPKPQRFAVGVFGNDQTFN